MIYSKNTEFTHDENRFSLMADLTVGGQSLEPSFSPDSTFLVSTKRRRWIKLIEGVGPNNAGIQTGRHFKDLGPFIGPNSSAETIRGIVSLRECFLRASLRVSFPKT